MLRALRGAQLTKWNFSSRLLIVLCLLAPDFLQAQDFRGSLVGTVSDVSGGRIQGAEILLRGVDSATERQVTGDVRGEFRFSDLPPGNYRLTVKAHGFADAQSNVSIVVTAVQDVSVKMDPALFSKR